MAKAQSLLEKLIAGLPLNPQMVLRKVLESEGHENIDELMQVEPPQPDPEVELERARFEHQVKLETAEHQLKVNITQFEAEKDRAAAALSMAKAAEAESGMQIGQITTLVDSQVKQEDAISNRIQAEASANQAKQKPAEKGSK